jgi:uncharacterized membrane protein
MMSILVKNSLIAAFVAVVVFCSYLMLRITVPYFSFEYDVDFLLTKQSILHVDAWRISFYVHIGTSIFVLFLGVFQFVKPILTNYPSWHRAAGKMYVLFVLVLSGPSGLVMGFYSNGGIWAKTSFVILSILWWWTTLQAYLKIRKGKVGEHLAYMTRSYALTFSAITLRTYVLVFPHFFILPSREMYVLVAWLSWIPNLLVAEVLIKKKVFR